MILCIYDFCLNKPPHLQSSCFRTSLRNKFHLRTEFCQIHTFFHLKTILHRMNRHGTLMCLSRFSFLRTITPCKRWEDLLTSKCHSLKVNLYPIIHHKTSLIHQHTFPCQFSCCPSTILHSTSHHEREEFHSHFFHIEKRQHHQ